MIKHAWSLVFFTVLGQMGAGLYLVHKLISFAGRFSATGIQPGPKRFLMLSFIVSILALLISFSHLGHPKNAIYALSNIRTSWLSREVFLLSSFIAIMLFEIVFAQWTGQSAIRQTSLSIAGIITALAFVFAMIRLYQLETVPAWNSAYTFFHFNNTALLGGAMLLLAGSTNKPDTASIYVLVALTAVQLILCCFLNTAAGKTSYLPLLFYGLLIVILLLQAFKAMPEQAGLTVKIICFACFAAGLLIERYQFYASYESVGL